MSVLGRMAPLQQARDIQTTSAGWATHGKTLVLWEEIQVAFPPPNFILYLKIQLKKKKIKNALAFPTTFPPSC